MATIIDIAREAGVSPSLVSYVLNKKSPVKKDLHKKIIELARKHNYVPNSTAKTMVTGRTNNIMFVIQRSFLGTLHETFFQELLLYLATLLSNRNIGLMLYASEDSDTEGLKRAVLSRRADGIIWYLSEVPSDIRELLVEINCPTVVMIGNDEKLSCVRYDDYKAEGDLLEAVYNAGHRKIAYFGMSAVSPRIRAYDDMRVRHGIDYRRVFSSNLNDYIAVRNELRAQLESNPIDFTCIAAEKDLTAIYILNAFEEMGIKVPDQVSVTGYDDISDAANKKYNLTTVRQDYRLLCNETVDCLMHMIEQDDPNLVRVEKILPCSVIMRSTLNKIDI